MCLFFCYTDPVPSPKRFKLILIMNRDEYFDRPTSPAEWKDGVLCGRDELSIHTQGGTWCGMDEKGRIGILTNVFGGRQEEVNHLAGRGSLVIDYLKGYKSPLEYMKDLISKGILYKPHNLILLEQNNKTSSYEIFYYAQGFNDGLFESQDGPRQLSNSHLCIGNHYLRRPFLKTLATEKKLMGFIELYNSVENKEDIIAALYEAFSSKISYFPDPEIEELKGSDEFLMVNDKSIASPFIQSSNHEGRTFGTRSQTIVLIDYYNKVDYYESTRDLSPQTKEERYTKVFEEFKLG